MRVTTGVVRAALVVALSGSVWAGCSPKPGGTVEESVVSSEGLAATMGVSTSADAVELTLHVTNTSGAPIELEFSSGQRYDFQVSEVVDGVVGETVWTWSADKSFMQALGTETLAPGASLRYTETWPANGSRGDFMGIATLTSTSHPVRQTVSFDLPGGE